MSACALDRRGLLLGGSAIALAQLGGCRANDSPAAEPQVEPGPDRPPRDIGATLVLLELFGGVDGLSVVVPIEDDAYYRARPTTKIAKSEVLALDDERGWHPALKRTRRRYQRGHVAIVEGCGYPDPIYSHFRSFEVWHTARAEGRASGDGWIGRLRAEAWGDDPRAELVLHVGGEAPYSLASRAHPALAFTAPESFQWVAGDAARGAFAASAQIDGANQSASGREAVLARMRATLSSANQTSQRVLAATADYRPRVQYPVSPLSDSLRTIAALMNSGFPTRVYSVAFGNFDTHGSIMRGGYFRLLGELDKALNAFLDDIADTQQCANTLVLAFSEFGRRLHENHSRGTDHGAAGPMLLMGERVLGGRYGAQPSLRKLDGDGNLIFTTDFRRVYASVVNDAFGVANERVLGLRYSTLPLIA